MGLRNLFRQRKQPDYSDGVIDLYRLNRPSPPSYLQFGETLYWKITETGKKDTAGEISLRLGEGVGIYYYGHVGYHVDPPYRGHGYAVRACRLIAQYARKAGKGSLVITTDPDNLASRKTCEHLGCYLERQVTLTEQMQRKLDLPAEKCRYILILS
ncbi:MAG: GNAT family N-acetyltransferase [Clostridia bacterium]|nr:GNAT family N-acetyltransferase [Clostridia bacterium]